MKKFFKFTPPIENKEFKISKPNIAPTISKEMNIKSSISENVKLLKNMLHFPDSNDVNFRFIDIHINDKTYNAFLVFYDGLVDSKIINDYILERLMTRFSLEPSNSVIKGKESISIKDILSGTVLADLQVSFELQYDKVISSLLHGDSALFVDTLEFAFICDSKNIPGRGVSKAENEMNLKGPSEAFTENYRTNTALIRKFVKDENLIFETAEVGNKSKTKCAIAYISNITNDSLVNEVRTRINSIDIDYLIDSGQLEQLIEDKTYLVDPLILNTERPDKVASNLTEGRVAVIVEGSPNVLVMPAVFSDFTHSSEDSYIRHPYSLLLRIFRLPALFFSVFLPGLYIAICDFHQEMIPTDLLFAIAGTREKVPFTMLIELLIMEVAFEIIREASIRTPAPVGPTLGIVGTLILGQAIVSANIVSPILVIIVALTGISTFTVANFSLNYSFRILRFLYIFLGAFAGFFGIALGVFIHMCVLTTASSFGVPYLTPFAPFRKSVFKDDLLSSPLWKQEIRPVFLKPKKLNKEPKISRKWTKRM